MSSGSQNQREDKAQLAISTAIISNGRQSRGERRSFGDVQNSEGGYGSPFLINAANSAMNNILNSECDDKNDNVGQGGEQFSRC